MRGGQAGGQGGGLAFEHDVCDAARTAQALHFERFAEEGKQAGVEVDFADECEQRLGGSADGGGDFEAVDRRVALGTVPYLAGVLV